ncbi:MAG: fibrobacter succinogenes major paralogous domain-containing protein [Fibrobacter sp.]|nr:fibrobacter succinogenes major paralogous domain-containing protein [Fibrobacter sp.]
MGTQVWMAQNIDYLPEDTVGTKYGGRTICGGGESGTAIEGDCFVYGRLYERSVLIDSIGNGQVVCPDGWIIPSSGDWDVLIDYLGGESVAGKKMKLNDSSMWGENMEHSNESGFSATLTGYFYFVRPQFNDALDKNKRTSMLIYPVESKSIIVRTKTIYDDKDLIKDGNYTGNYGISVRCIKKIANDVR